MSPFLAALAIAIAGEACVANHTAAVVGFMAIQEAADGVRIKLLRQDIAAGAQLCFSTAWERDRPITSSVSKPGGQGEFRDAVRCPAIASGASARFVVTLVNDRLVCQKAGE